MRDIVKNAEPRSLTEHRASAYADYENYAAKSELRAALTAEQRGLCCYCMGRIRNDAAAMKIEHWRCQANNPDLDLDYGNLLGACMGGEGQPRESQHCDTRKGNDDLRWNPADPTHRVSVRIVYDMDGTIRSTDPTFDAQLNEVLNLNLPWLRNNRKGVLDGLLDWWRSFQPINRDRLQRELDKRVVGNGNGELSPYCEVAMWWLRQKLEAKQ